MNIEPGAIIWLTNLIIEGYYPKLHQNWKGSYVVSEKRNICISEKKYVSFQSILTFTCINKEEAGEDLISSTHDKIHFQMFIEGC